MAARLDKNLQDLTKEDIQKDQLRRQIQVDKLMIMLIENPLQLWKYLNAKVKNAWMERIVVCKRLYRDICNLAKIDENKTDENST